MFCFINTCLWIKLLFFLFKNCIYMSYSYNFMREFDLIFASLFSLYVCLSHISFLFAFFIFLPHFHSLSQVFLMFLCITLIMRLCLYPPPPLLSLILIVNSSKFTQIYIFLCYCNFILWGCEFNIKLG
jgi:hypothetical protein